MSQTVITTAFEQWKARQAESSEPVLLDEFVFASVPGLDPTKPVNRSEVLPPDAQIVYRQSVTRKGVVNDNAVVHSVVLGADVGDFSFNWIGLINKASGTLAMIVHAPVQQKLKTREGQQGNVLTRSFLMEYNGAQVETGISTPAETWQIDFTARMAGMDERQRIANLDIYGQGAFFDDGWLVARTGSQFFVTRGVGYVGGLRAELAADANFSAAAKPAKVWLDVSWTGSLTSVWHADYKITVASELDDYEINGTKHYVFALASVDEKGTITDLRPKGGLSDQQANNNFLRKDRNLEDVSDKAGARKTLKVYSQDETDAKVKEAADAADAANQNADSRVKKSGDVLTGALVSTAQDTWRIKQPKQSFFFRFDGSNFYLLKTKANDPDGAWDDSRPFSVNADSGAVTFGNGFTSNANIRVSWGGKGHVYQENGDIVESGGTSSIFRGYWGATNLNGALRNITNRADDAWNKANDAQVNRVTSGWVDGNYLPRGQNENTIGTFVMAWSNTGNVDFNTFVSGGNLFPSTADGSHVGWSLPGTWRCCGAMRTTNDAHRVSLWQRVA
ncbi:phage tail protein [Pantoea sp. CTOTU50773]|uniref:phage tail protein n=1 Tax=Pantoea sp. CTOTU50773 TaxID=2953853 RepID=UPI0028B0D759|nr:phage tail protein [Pantoea sp. CTOTU50773]